MQFTILQAHTISHLNLIQVLNYTLQQKIVYNLKCLTGNCVKSLYNCILGESTEVDMAVIWSSSLNPHCISTT